MNSWCSNYNSQYCNMMDPCSCGHFHTHPSNPNSLSMICPSINGHFTSSPPSDSDSSSPVDCTLSLGTPSTRLTNHNQSQSSSYNFCWEDILQPKSSARETATSYYNSGDRRPLLERRCANCNTNSTPLWRNGPTGPKSLCNACGIRFKKEERRAAATNRSGGGGGTAGMVVVLPTHYY